MVRDDAERLRRCIQSVKGAVDEIVVLDTGSKDDTVTVARSEGAAVTEIVWPNSFAAGLNALLDLVKTEWTLRLDSDEWFEADIKTPLQDCMADEGAFGFRLIRRDIQPHGGFEEVALLRLWRTHPDLRYKGVVHENIPIARFGEVWPGKVEKAAAIWFWHDGYQQGHLDKIKRNVPLMEQELQAHPGQAYYEAMLAKGYKDIGDPKWEPMMLDVVERSLSDDQPATPVLSVIYSDVLNSLQVGPNDAGADPIAAKAVEWFWRSPGVMIALSNMQLRRGRKREALEALLLIERMATTGEYDRSMPVNPAVFGKEFWKHLDRLADQLGQYEICKRCERHL